MNLFKRVTPVSLLRKFINTRISFHYEYTSTVMMSLIFLGVKQCDAIKHI